MRLKWCTKAMMVNKMCNKKIVMSKWNKKAVKYNSTLATLMITADCLFALNLRK